MKVVIVEDSRLARLELKELLKAHPELELAGEAADVATAKTLIEDLRPDLLLLDIDLAGQSAFDLLAELLYVPDIIFTTAFSEHALQAFDYPTVDYLLKPVTASRLAKALAKMASAAKQEPAATEPQGQMLNLASSFFVKDNEHCYMVCLADVRWFEAVGNYTKVHFKQHAPMVYRALGAVEQRLAAGLFFRANRGQLVNLAHIKAIEPWVNGGLMLRLSCDTQIEVSRRQSSLLRQELTL
jgi:two-component system LytT family response regulator